MANLEEAGGDDSKVPLRSVVSVVLYLHLGFFVIKKMATDKRFAGERGRGV